MRLVATFAQTRILHTSGILLANMAVQSISGYLFWWLSKQRMDSSDLGIASATLGICVLLANIASLGLGSSLIYARRQLADQFWAGANAALLITFASGFVAATVFVLGIPFWSPGMQPYHDLDGWAVITFTTTGIALSTLQDSLLLAEKRALRVVCMSIGAAVVRSASVLLLVPVFHDVGTVAGYGGGNWFVVIWGAFTIWQVPSVALRACFDFRRLNSLFTYSRDTYLVSVFGTASSSILPAIVLNILGPVEAAHFYIAALLAGLLFAVPGTISMALFVENMSVPGTLAQQSRQALWLSLLASVLCGGGLLLAAPYVIGTFGSSYVDASTLLLSVFVISGVPMAFYTVGQAVFRARGQTAPLAIMAAAVLVVTAASATAAAHAYGLVGVALGWLAGQTVGALLWALARGHLNDAVDSRV